MQNGYVKMVNWNNLLEIRVGGEWEPFELLYRDERWPNFIFGKARSAKQPNLYTIPYTPFRNTAEETTYYVVWYRGKDGKPFVYTHCIDLDLVKKHVKPGYWVTIAKSTDEIIFGENLYS